MTISEFIARMESLHADYHKASDQTVCPYCVDISEAATLEVD